MIKQIGYILGVLLLLSVQMISAGPSPDQPEFGRGRGDNDRGDRDNGRGDRDNGRGDRDNGRGDRDNGRGDRDRDRWTWCRCRIDRMGNRFDL